MYKFKVWPVYSQDSEFKTMLDALSKARVFSIERNNNYTVDISEECDTAFSLMLSKQELLDLAEEIKAIAESLTEKD